MILQIIKENIKKCLHEINPELKEVFDNLLMIFTLGDNSVQ